MKNGTAFWDKIKLWVGGLQEKAKSLLLNACSNSGDSATPVRCDERQRIAARTEIERTKEKKIDW